MSASCSSADVGGSVPATLALSTGTPANFGPFTPGVAREYTATMSANVVSTAGEATLSVADPSSTATGTGGDYTPVGGSAAPTSVLAYAGPTSNDTVTLGFRQSIGANEALRTGTYGKTLTFTLSTVNP